MAEGVSEFYMNLDVALDVGSAIFGVVVLYLIFRVVRGLSFPLQKRAFYFFLFAALFFLSSELVSGLESLLVSSIYGVFVDIADVATIACVGVAAYFLIKSEREEISSLRRSADVNDLTGLPNRSFFGWAANRRIALSRENGIPLSCLMLDIDDFKPHNDKHGHGAGDLALIRVANVLRDSARADDITARYGGEEFVLLMNGGPEEAAVAAERVRSEVERKCSPERDGSIMEQITVSLGVAPLTEETRTLEELVEAADRQMYRAKRAGKNRVSVN